MKLTEAQTWALEGIRDGKAASPSALGVHMMERPGAMPPGRKRYKSQGYGRMGGAMIARLERMGLAYAGGWKTPARINGAGLAAIAAARCGE